MGELLTSLGIVQLFCWLTNEDFSVLVLNFVLLLSICDVL